MQKYERMKGWILRSARRPSVHTMANDQLKGQGPGWNLSFRFIFVSSGYMATDNISRRSVMNFSNRPVDLQNGAVQELKKLGFGPNLL